MVSKEMNRTETAIDCWWRKETQKKEVKKEKENEKATQTNQKMQEFLNGRKRKKQSESERDDAEKGKEEAPSEEETGALLALSFKEVTGRPDREEGGKEELVFLVRIEIR
ncbi:hypothetical protein QOT17_020032 [Balamuthia mandrillaris]